MNGQPNKKLEVVDKAPKSNDEMIGDLKKKGFEVYTQIQLHTQAITENQQLLQSIHNEIAKLQKSE